MSLPRFTLTNFAALFSLNFPLAHPAHGFAGTGRRWNGNPMAKRRRRKLKGWQRKFK